MKHQGSTSEFATQRADELLAVWRELCSQAEVLEWKSIMRQVVNSPCSRFWVSEERAAIVIGSMLRGVSLQDMTPTKREMFDEIFQRFQALRKQKPHLSMATLVMQVVNSPAPKFYLTPYTAYVYVNKHKRFVSEQRRKHLARFANR